MSLIITHHTTTVRVLEISLLTSRPYGRHN